MQGKSALETKLQEKEQLIGALTQRLEQAAEQLDRIHRSGGDRGMRQAGGLPPELIQQHQELVEDLQRAVQHWEEMEAAALLGRIEGQLSELRDLVSGQLVRSPAPEPARPDSIAGFMSRTKTAAGGGATRVEEEPSSTGSGSYERLKAGLLDADSESQAGNTKSVAGSAGDEQWAAEDSDPVEPPQPFDLDAADADELKQAVEGRDRYIAYLSRKLRISETRKGPSGDWKALENVPDELRAQLEDYERRLEEALRQAEVELSLERARLGREAARLRTMEHQIASDRKRFKLLADVDAKVAAGRPGNRAESDDEFKSGRWLRMLGIGRGDDDED